MTSKNPYPAALVGTDKVLEKIEPFIARYNERKEEIERASADYLASCISRYPFMFEASMKMTFNRAIVISKICHASVDGTVMISADDLIFSQTIDAADIDINIARLIRKAKENREDQIRAREIRASVEIRQRQKRAMIWLGVGTVLVLSIVAIIYQGVQP